MEKFIWQWTKEEKQKFLQKMKQCLILKFDCRPWAILILCLKYLKKIYNNYNFLGPHFHMLVHEPKTQHNELIHAIEKKRKKCNKIFFSLFKYIYKFLLIGIIFDWFVCVCACACDHLKLICHL